MKVKFWLLVATWHCANTSVLDCDLFEEGDVKVVIEDAVNDPKPLL